MKTIAKLLALLLTIVMLLTLIGCGDDTLKEEYRGEGEGSTVSGAPSDEDATEEGATTTDGKAEGGDTLNSITIGSVDSDLDFSELYMQMGIAQYLSADGYSAASWQRLQQALLVAENVLAAMTQEEVDQAVAALQAAIDGLEWVGTGTPAKNTTTAAKPATQQTTKKPSTTAAKTTTTRKSTTTRVTTTTKASLLNQVPDSLNGTKIKMLIWWNVAADDTEKANAFYKETGITMAYEPAAMDKYLSSLSGKIMAGNPPAMAAIINEWYPRPITRGLMQPIANTGWDYSDKSVYAHNLMDQFAYKGNWYGIALKGSTMTTFEVMFFNKKMLKANGVSQDPYQLWKSGQWNWDTCLEIAKKCTNTKNGKYGLSLLYQNYWMLSAGQDFVLSDKNGLKNNVKSTSLLNAWTYAWDMIYTHKVVSTNYQSTYTDFYNGNCAMFAGGSYFMQANVSYSNYYVPQNMTDDWGVVPFPSPKGQAAVAGCEGIVWGFPTKVKGNQLQAAMWFLRYYLDDANNTSRDFYATEECWEVVNWMWNQKIQSYNSVGVITYDGKHTPSSVQYSLIDEASNKAQVQSNLNDWYAEIQTNIDGIHTEMD